MSLGSCDRIGVSINARLNLVSQNPWYVLLAKPKHEKRVAEAVGGKGYEAFLPLYLARRRWLSTSRDVSLPLFPHYVFCRMDPERRLPILQIPGVRAIVSFGRAPIPVDDSEIQSVRAMVTSGLRVAPHHFLCAGARVRVMAGPLSGIEGILETVKGQDRLQERWMAEHRRLLPGVTMIGVGAAFDFHAGRIRQAPPWMQNAGLEWFFRLCTEPSRLWRRYILKTPLFLPLWALQKIGILRYHYSSDGQ